MTEVQELAKQIASVKAFITNKHSSGFGINPGQFVDLVQELINIVEQLVVMHLPPERPTHLVKLDGSVISLECMDQHMRSHEHIKGEVSQC